MFRHRSIALTTAAVILIAAGCGAEQANDGAAAGSGGVAGVDPAPWCDEIEIPEPSVEGSLGALESVDFDFLGALESYGAEHADSYAGYWYDRDRGGVVVVAFTDEPEVHLGELKNRRAGPDDVAVVLPEPETTATTTMGESGFAFDVVQVANTGAELRELSDSARAVLDTAGIDVSSVSYNPSRNLVGIGVVDADDDDRRLVGDLLPPGQVCVEESSPVEAGVPPPAAREPGDFAMALSDYQERWQRAITEAGRPEWVLDDTDGQICAPGFGSEGGSGGTVRPLAGVMEGRSPTAIALSLACTGEFLTAAGLSVELTAPVSEDELALLVDLSGAFLRFVNPESTEEELADVISALALADPTTWEAPGPDVRGPGVGAPYRLGDLTIERSFMGPTVVVSVVP